MKRSNVNEPVAKIASNNSDAVGMENWETFVDEKYGYSYSHPPVEGKVSSYRRESYGLNIRPAWTSGAKQPDLYSFAQELWNKNKNLKNVNFPDRILTPLRASQFNGSPAYTFEASGFFADDSSQYILDAKNVYTITANQNGQIFIINFPSANDVGAKVFSTVIINAGLIAPKPVPANWVRFEDPSSEFEFSYPGNVFPYKSNPQSYTLMSVSGKSGGIAIQSENKILDPQNIQGPDGEVVKKPTPINVIDHKGYSYSYADGNCQSKYIRVESTPGRTLTIIFSSCDDALYPLAEDKDLQSQILATFKFKK